MGYEISCPTEIRNLVSPRGIRNFFAIIHTYMAALPICIKLCAHIRLYIPTHVRIYISVFAKISDELERDFKASRNLQLAIPTTTTHVQFRCHDNWRRFESLTNNMLVNPDDLRTYDKRSNSWLDVASRSPTARLPIFPTCKTTLQRVSVHAIPRR